MSVVLRMCIVLCDSGCVLCCVYTYMCVTCVCLECECDMGVCWGVSVEWVCVVV